MSSNRYIQVITNKSPRCLAEHGACGQTGLVDGTNLDSISSLYKSNDTNEVSNLLVFGDIISKCRLGSQSRILYLVYEIKYRNDG